MDSYLDILPIGSTAVAVKTKNQWGQTPLTKNQWGQNQWGQTPLIQRIS